MKSIAPINIWSNGQQKTANLLSLHVISDNLSTSAIFYYELLENQESTNLIQGNLTMDGQEYQNWGLVNEINDDAYTWAANKLNITLI